MPAYYREYQQLNWDQWKPGDKIVWLDDLTGQIFSITKISYDTGYVYWNDPLSGRENWTHASNLARVIIHGDNQAEGSSSQTNHLQ